MELSIINYVDSKLTPKLCEQWVQTVTVIIKQVSSAQVSFEYL